MLAIDFPVHSYSSIYPPFGITHTLRGDDDISLHFSRYAQRTYSRPINKPVSIQEWHRIANWRQLGLVSTLFWYLHLLRAKSRQPSWRQPNVRFDKRRMPAEWSVPEQSYRTQGRDSMGQFGRHNETITSLCKVADKTVGQLLHGD